MKRWKPKVGQRYWFMRYCNYVYADYYIWHNWIRDIFYYKTNNCFRTRKEAEAELKKVRGGK